MPSSRLSDLDLETLLDEVISPLESLSQEPLHNPPPSPSLPLTSGSPARQQKHLLSTGIRITLLLGFGLFVGFFWGKMHRQNTEFQNLAHQTLEYLEQIHENLSQDPGENLPSLRPPSKNEEIAPTTPV
ncbi:MAG: hypothetical protein K940chlam9_00504 [Chlamydiae bacterium]|nr:hypothetical protein [Chlamydiota bacterium]